MIPRTQSSNQQAVPSDSNTVNQSFHPHQSNVAMNPTDFRPPVFLPGQVPSIEAQPPLTSHPIQFNLINPLQTSVLSPPPLAGFTTTSLTSIPSSHSGGTSKSPKNSVSFLCRSNDFSLHQKRSSVEMEDDLTTKEAPPTKQLLSETKLFKQFGSLNIDNENIIDKDDVIEVEDEQNCKFKDAAATSDVLIDTDDDDIKCKNVRREFENYVYLLFKGKDSSSSDLLPKQSGSNAIIDRMFRDEREKLSKAVILWSPPLKDSFQTLEDSDDEEFTYKDHRDFLKNTTTDQSSIVIEEISEVDGNTDSVSTMEATSLDEESDDVMAIE